jgi:metal-responsive CopG/Arc/MetJ family transcriptional regulator
MAKAEQTAASRMRTISLTIESDLLAEVDTIAAAESRSRAKQISVALRRFVEAWRETRVAEPRKRRRAA